MYSRSAESVLGWVARPPLHIGMSLPTGCVAAGIHLKPWPPSRERQTYEMFEPRLPGTLVYTRPCVSRRRSCSKPNPWTPLMVGFPNVGRGGAAAGARRRPADGEGRGRAGPALADLAKGEGLSRAIGS